MTITAYPGGLGATNAQWGAILAALESEAVSAIVEPCLSDDPTLYIEIALDGGTIAVVLAQAAVLP